MSMHSTPHAPDRVRALERRVRALSAFASASSVAAAVLLFGAFQSPPGRQRFREIDVERINVVQPDGSYAVVIANQDRLPGNIMNGLEYSDRSGMGGILFYNAEGDESGGLIHASARGRDGVRASGQLSLDRFEGDQVAAVRYLEGPGYYEAGLQVSRQQRGGLVRWSRSADSISRLPAAARPQATRELRRRAFREGNWEVPRVFAGETGRSAQVRLHDQRGRLRIRISVDSLDVPRLEMLDTAGAVAYALPGSRP